MSSWTDSLRDAAKRVDVAVEALQGLQKLTGIGGAQATEVLTVIDAGMRSIIEMFSGATSPDITKADIDAAIQALNDKLASNNAEIKSEIDKQFDDEPNPG